MPLRGGASAKVGDRYELRWTVAVFCDVLRGRVDSVRLEPPGDDGCEFSAEHGGLTTYHQVKRQVREGKWSLQSLKSSGVLTYFMEKLLADEAGRCSFVSMCDAPELRELADRARQAESLSEFRRAFLASDEWTGNFTQLRNAWQNCSDEECFELLKRIHSEPVGERELCKRIDAELELVVTDNSATVRDALCQYVLDSVHQTIAKADLYGFFATRKLELRDWTSGGAVRRQLTDLTTAYQRRLRRELIEGEVLARSESQETLRALTTNEPSLVLVAGAAGAGKSTVLLETVDAVAGQGWPVLPIRADQVEPTTTARQLGERLGLPASPAAVLAGVCGSRPGLLLIDQLDAMSLASGRQPERLDSLLECIEQALRYPSLRVLIACRVFDIDNDHRLRAFAAREKPTRIEVAPLGHDIVRDVVGEYGLDPTALSEKQLVLLSLPLHLALLGVIAEGGTSGALDFSTASDLFDAYWRRKEQLAQQRAGRPIDWTGVIDRVCGHLSQHQTLHAPDVVVDDVRRDALVLESEHVLARDGNQISFFHESFFDYAFARRFAASGLRLLDWLREDEQHLFRRAQVRQILTFLRGRDRTAYLTALRGLLTDDHFRSHIRHMVLGLLRHWADPWADEWDVLATLPANGNALADAAWRVVFGRPAWLAVLAEAGAVSRLLTSSESSHVDAGVELLRGVQRELPDLAAEHLQAHYQACSDWGRRVSYVVGLSRVGASRSFFEMTVEFLHRGALDPFIQEHRDALWSMSHDLSKQQPAWSCELLGAYLGRLHDEPSLDSSHEPFGVIESGGGHFEGIVQRMVEGAPLAYVEHLLPVMLRYMQDRRRAEAQEPPWTDDLWWYRSSDRHWTKDILLWGMEQAFRWVAANDPDRYVELARQLVDSECETAWHLLMTGYAANTDRFGSAASRFLQAQPSMVEGSPGSRYSAPRGWIGAIIAHTGEAETLALEEMLLAYAPEWERRPDARRYRGTAQQALLRGIPADLRSDRVTKRLQELERKLGAPQGRDETSGRTMSRVEPAVGGQRAHGLSDDDWLQVVQRFRADRLERIAGEALGGAHTQAQVLEACAKEQPSRFAQLLHRLPDDSHPAYFGAVLRALAGRVDDEVLVAAAQRCHEIPERPLGIETCRALRQLSGTADDRSVDLVRWYAEHGHGPHHEPTLNADDCSDSAGHEFLHAGINCTRGAAAGAVETWLWHDRVTLDRARAVLDHMVADTSLAVRSCVAEALLPILNTDRDCAVTLFVTLCSNTEDSLLATPPVTRFFQYATWTHYDSLAPIVDRMVASNLAAVAMKGARVRAFAGLAFERHKHLLDEIVAGSEPQRLGAAQLLAVMLTKTQYRHRCDATLQGLFCDESERVRNAAASWVRHIDDQDDLNDYDEFIRTFSETPAFAHDQFLLVRRLAAATDRLPRTTLHIARRFIEEVGNQASSIAGSAAMEAEELSRLVVRLYSQASDAELRRECLDVLDLYCDEAAYKVDEALAAVDR